MSTPSSVISYSTRGHVASACHEALPFEIAQGMCQLFVRYAQQLTLDGAEAKLLTAQCDQHWQGPAFANKAEEFTHLLDSLRDRTARRLVWVGHDVDS